MTLLIDEMVLQLKLDPSTWAPGERKALQSLRDLETSAQKSGRKVEAAGGNIVSFFRNVEHPIASLRKKFEDLATVTVKPQQNLANLATQAERTGDSVEAGALTAAAGIRALGAAGLGAVAVITALGAAYKLASNESRKLFPTSIGAATAGVGITQFTAISQALRQSGNVPQEQTQNWLARYQSARQKADAGDYSEAVALNQAIAQAIGKTGMSVDVFSEKDPIKAIQTLARALATMTEPEASARGQMMQMTPELALALRGAGGNLPGMIRAEEGRAATREQEEAAKRLISAQNDLANSWDNLARNVLHLNDVFATFDTWVARIIDHIAGIGGGKGGEGALGGSFPSAQGDPLLGGSTGGGVPPALSRFWNWVTGKPGGTSSDVQPRSDSTQKVPGVFTPPSGPDVSVISDTVKAAGGNEKTQAAFLAMMNPESGLNPSRVEEGVGGSAGVGGRGGASWAQWTGPRRRQLENFGWTGQNLEDWGSEVRRR